MSPTLDETTKTPVEMIPTIGGVVQNIIFVPLTNVEAVQNIIFVAFTKV